ncbi:AT-rich interactive domain-containing protein 3A [Dasypus novemcinctus]|uniref:AT-rich interactive domain-containing protein 3A n=1 Tax=Dasypus novemcinctus TaxID=9361 RepID=UPI0026600016|nr:AT-rich interactive domain-containing protein 3A [Dasypus novemcinctus]XP_058138211.1 AT-rich interactive domain-containing protein 3A [Dasypus novemcinctus]XP_058138212.1 AT-rich interactive domain-containing protein 3A [Dasypus novemcinctus]
MKLQAVMETLLQRQQQARQELEARQPPDPPAGPPARARPTPDEDREAESARMQRAQMAALAAMRAAAAGLGHPPGAEDAPPGSEDEAAAQEGTPGSPAPPARGREGPGRPEGEGPMEDTGSDEDLKQKWEDEELEELADEDEDYEDDEDDEDEDDDEGLGPPGPAGLGAGALFPRKAQPPQPFRGDGLARAPGGQERPGPPAHPGAAAQAPPPLQPPDHGDWTYEEQFKQLYELDGDPKRKEFLDDLFSFMQKRGTPVNRIPIMAKQVLDLFMLYVLVTEKGGLVEVINKKLWREVTKGLNLPTSITSAAFTLRTQYMKYLYPYECEKRGLSNPNELQAAIDSNRREGRRQSFGGSLFTYSPGGAHGLLSSPKLPSLGLAASTNGSSIAPAPKIKKEEDSAVPIAVPGRLPVSLAGHPVVAVQAAAAQAAVAAQAVALEQLREKLESGEPPEKKMALVTDEQQRLMQRALQQNFLAMTAQLPMSIRINSQASESRPDSAANVNNTNGSNSISMSVEINGIMYTGVLFAQPPAPTPPAAPSKGGGGRGGSSGPSSGAGGQGPAGLSAAPTSSTSNNSLP